MKRWALLAVPAAAEDALVPPNSIVATAPAADWKTIDPADLLVMDLAPGRNGNSRANRQDDFYIRPAGGVDICSLPVPIRRVQP